MTRKFRVGAAAWILALAGTPAMAAMTYQASLGPMPLDDQSKLVLQGRGNATATLDGKTLTVSGTFGAMVSPATGAHLFLSPAIGVPGTRAQDLAVPAAASGAITGSVTLTMAQVTAFRTGRLYIQIDSQKAPDGTLWGWLLPSHEIAGQDVPQQGHWFLPQLDTPSK